MEEGRKKDFQMMRSIQIHNFPKEEGFFWIWWDLFLNIPFLMEYPDNFLHLLQSQALISIQLQIAGLQINK